MLDYCKICEALGEDTNLAGYPGYSGGGHYFSSQKDLDEAVSVIQNRVQLYLDENG